MTTCSLSNVHGLGGHHSLKHGAAATLTAINKGDFASVSQFKHKDSTELSHAPTIEAPASRLTDYQSVKTTISTSYPTKRISLHPNFSSNNNTTADAKKKQGGYETFRGRMSQLEKCGNLAHGQ